MKLVLALIIAGAILAFAAWMIGPSFCGGASRRTQMLSKCKGCATALNIYAESHDDRLPHARNWSDAVLPYLRTSPYLPEAQSFSAETPRGAWTSVTMNWSAGGTEIQQVVSPEKTVLLFEAEGKRTGAIGTAADLWAGYEGKSIYCSFDTACRKITPYEIRLLRWEVDGSSTD